MSNALAIGAVTATLEAILGSGVHADPDLADTNLTALPPDKARGSISSNQLNLFLYQVLPNAAWRNQDLPGMVKPGETGVPPLALNLHYLVTVFGRDNDNSQPFDHHLLGRAMSLLHDHALLGPDEIRLAFPGSELERQVERVRITLRPLDIEEISKLWTGFATQYRLSVAYEVSLVLIDSTQPVRAPLPALTRGAKDSGPIAQGNLVPPFPALTGLALPHRQASARLGDVLTLTGNLLDGSQLGVLFQHSLWSQPLEIPPQAGGSSTQLQVQLPPGQPAVWPAGLYSVAVAVLRPGETARRFTNALSFALAPEIAISPTSAPAGSVPFTITCSPEVWPGQNVSLLIADQAIALPAVGTVTGTLAASATLATGNWFVRLRVDGVDSLLVDNSATLPVFDPSQQVTIT